VVFEEWRIANAPQMIEDDQRCTEAFASVLPNRHIFAEDPRAIVWHGDGLSAAQRLEARRLINLIVGVLPDVQEDKKQKGSFAC
jgi:hypothetical protein